MAFDIGELVGRLKIDDKGFEKGLDGSESKFKQFGAGLGKLAAGIGAGAALALGVAIVQGLSQQDVGAKVAAQLGEGSAEAAQYGKIAGQIYADNWGDSLETIGDTIKSIQQAQLVPKDAGAGAIKAVAEQAQILSDVFGQDVTGSVNAVQQMLRTGLAPDAKTAFDLITKGIEDGDDKAGDLLDTLNEYPTQLRKLGIDGQTALGLISQGLKAGARDSDIVADALKEFSIRAVDGSTTTAAGFKLLGINGKTMSEQIGKGGTQASAGLQTVLDKLRAIKDPVQQAAAATDLFGTQSEDLGKALFALDPKTATKSLGDFTDATAKAGKTASNTANNNLKSFERQVQEAFVSTLGGKVIPMISSAASFLSTNFAPALKSTGEFIKQNQAWLTPLAVTLGTLAGIILVVVGAMKIWAVVTETLTAVQTALDIAMDANPIGVVIIAILALAAGITYLWFHSAAFRDFFIGFWNFIWGVLKAIGGWFAGPFTDFFVAAFHFIIGQATWFWTTTVGIWNAIWGFIKGIGAWFAGPFAGFFVAGFNMVVSAAASLRAGVISVWNSIKGAAQSVANGITGFFAAMGHGIASAWDSAVGAARSAINSLIGLANNAIGVINGVINTINKIPGVNVSHVSSIPKLAGGGAVAPRPGGTPVVMGDGGQVEYGVPKSDMEAIIAQAIAAARGGGGGGGSDGAMLTVVISGTGVLSGIRKKVRVQGGDAQTVLVGT